MNAPGHALRRSNSMPFDRVDAVDLAAMCALIFLPLWTFRSSYGGTTFMVAGLIGISVAAATLALAQVLRWPAGVTAISLAVMYPIVAAVAFMPGLNLESVLPTPASLYETVRISIVGWKALVTTEPPVGNTDGLLVLPFGVAYLSAVLMLVGRQRRSTRLALLIVPFVILGLGIATGTTTPVAPYLEGIASVLIAIGWLAWHEERRRPSVEPSTRRWGRIASIGGYLAVSAIAGGGVAAAMPFDHGGRFVWRQEVVPPFDPRVYPSPLSGYRQYVKIGADATDAVDRPMFTISGLPSGVSVRLATMDSYDGVVWQVSGGDPDNPSLDDSGSFQRVGARIRPDREGQEVEVTVEIQEYADVWVPTVGEVVSLTFDGSTGGSGRDRALQRSFRYNRDTDTAATPIGLQPGDRYRMTVVLPATVDDVGSVQVDQQRVVGAAVSVPAIAENLVSPDLLQQAQAGERLDSVRSEMYRFGVYSDGDPALGHAPSRAGHSAGRLTEFLDDYPTRPMVGDAEQFASAYALLFRELGDTPTRVVMGFELDRPSNDEPLEVLQTDVDAWVEVPTLDKGWVWISPTPPRDQTALTTSQPQRPEPDYRSQKPDPPSIRDPEFEDAATTEGDSKPEQPKPTEQDRTPEEPAELPTWPIAGAGGAVAAAIGIPLALIALALLAVGGLKFARRRVRRRRGSPDRQIASGWREVEDYTVDLGFGLPATATRRESALVAGHAAVALAERTDDHVWSGGELDPETVQLYWQEVSDTLRSMRSELGWRARARAFVSLRSFRRRSRGRP